MPLPTILNPVPLPLPASEPNASQVLSNFPCEKQKQSNWCWAAVTACIDKFYGTGDTQQCVIVTKQLNQGGCCTNGGTIPCNRPSDTALALSAEGHLKQAIPAPLAFADLQQEISTSNGNPVACSLVRGTGSHAVAVVGWEVSGADQRVYVFDPDGSSQMVLPYSTFVNNASSTWVRSYLTH